jgi:uncharacterized repeat protein (TIGR03803 family)
MRLANHAWFRFRSLCTVIALLTIGRAGTLATAQGFSVLSEANTAYGTLIQGSDGLFYGTGWGNGTYSAGTVYKMDSAGNVTILHSFNSTGTDGWQPLANVIQASDGFLYGTTEAGGANDQGTVFRIDTSGNNYAILHSFGATATDGVRPYAPLIQATDGYLYGTTITGGIYGTPGGGTVFRIDSKGNYTILRSFGATSTDATVPNSGLLQAQDGLLYGTSNYGGAYGYENGRHGAGTVYRLDTAGNHYAILHSFGSTNTDGILPQCAVIQATDGYFYGTTYGGGANGWGTVFKMDSLGNVTILYSFGTTSTDGHSPYATVIQATDGFLYGTTAWGGAYNVTDDIYSGDGTVFRIDPSGNNYNIVHSFGATNLDGWTPMAGLLQAADRSIYGSSSRGLIGAGINYGAHFRIKFGRGFDSFDGGASDLLFRNTQAGDVVEWQVNGFNTTGQSDLFAGLPLVWQEVGTGDFCGTGASDILWRNTQTGDVVLWQMNGFNPASQIVIYPALPLVWQVSGIADFNGDSKADILWRNVQTGDVVLWQMSGATITHQDYVYQRLPLTWQVVGVGDFFGIGVAGVLWEDVHAGNVALWQLNGPTISSQTLLVTALPLVWQVAGIGDFNGDCIDDVLWRNTQTGDLVLWQMNGASFTPTLVAAQVPLAWQVTGTGDFFSRGVSDVVWRNTQTGDVYLWKMNGNTIADQGYLYQSLPLVWQIVAP